MISSSTKIYGLIGYPLGHSISFYIHNAGFKSASIDAIYLNIPINPEKFNQVVESLKYLPFSGFNVTIPFKERIIEYLDGISEISKLLKAVNTVYKDKDGNWIGDNTDFEGFLKTLKELNLSKEGVYLILGAGGASRAVCYSLIEYGVKKIILTNRTYERAEKLAEEIFISKGLKIEVIPWDEKEDISDRIILINTTSLGLDGKSIPWKASLKNVIFVYDLIYNPFKTPLIYLAEREGIPWKNGLDMLIYQACYSWERWFGFLGPIEVMKKEAEKVLCGF